MCWLPTGSIFRPGLAAVAGLVRIVAFIVFVREYSTGDPKKRLRAEFGRFSAASSVAKQRFLMVQS